MMWVTAAAVGALADVLVSPHLEYLGMRPDLCVSMLALSWSAAPGDRAEPPQAWGVGLLRDALSAGPLGVHAFAFLVTAYAAREARKIWLARGFLGRISFVAAATAFAGIAAFGMAVIVGEASLVDGALLAAAGGSAPASAAAVCGPMEIWTRLKTWVRSGYARLEWQ